MKIKFTKLKIIFFIITLVFLYVSVSKLISNTDHNFLFKIKSLVPNSIKTHLKNTIFLIPSLIHCKNYSTIYVLFLVQIKTKSKP